MKLGPVHIKLDLPGPLARSGKAVAQEKPPEARPVGEQDGHEEARKARSWRLLKLPGRSLATTTGPAQPREVRESLDFDSPLFGQLSPDLQQESKEQRHLWEYLCTLPIEEIGVPGYYPRLTNDLRRLKYRNLIYPVSLDTYVHIYPATEDARDFYIAIEPSNITRVPDLMDQIDKYMMSSVDRIKAARDDQERAELLSQFMDEICTQKGGLFRRGAIKVTAKELQGLKYLQLRDKQGLGPIEPLIKDTHIEDISCDGVGPVFLEHKIFGGLKANIHFDAQEDLDQFVIKLSERIGRPVTVREPIVDSVLPDGSRVNIVFGGEVSKKGSNFTIRKFSQTPMSVLELIEMGTLTYEIAGYLSITMGSGMNIFVSGETASGKTTLLNAITTFIDPSHKIVSIEDTPELQVPHPHWTREVVRGHANDDSSVTMFDLLRAALRQRPNYIIIGEIRGEEGSTAFQAMQTGHNCMATFHAASVEKLIQRLTGNPINIPKTYIDNLNLVVITSSVRLADGRTARRVLSINEILGYDTDADSFEYVEVFRWNPSTDQFEFPGYMNSRLLENVVAFRRGMLQQDSRRIYDEIDDRATILKRLHERGLSNFYDLYKVLSQAHREGLFR